MPGRGGPGFSGSVAICSVATVLLLIAIAGSRHPPRLANTGAPPWPAPSAAGVGVRLADLRLTPAPGVVTRYAIHLDIRHNGTTVSLPPGIGVDWAARELAPMYTSDDTGVVHIGSDDADPRFRLGQLFDEWQVPLHGATVYVDGSEQQDDPSGLLLQPHQEILVSFGSAPAAVPGRYAFPAGT